ncbi:unnamed protein product [Arctia plantaginis]|uniref:Uncharacterized protein n=1 Tax=Arctia plantaginis TaxID=874455 RepID=A0A8S0Z2W7_ARCPL|nr:unnamed protein product [Arctia plantaginis]
MCKGFSILIFVVLAGAQLIKSANIKPCKTYDTTCVTNTANNIFGIAINGDTSMNIERLDPIKHKYIEGNLAIIKYKLFNSTIVGFKDCNIVDANVTLEENSMHFKLICPYLYMYGKYEMSGLLVSVPIEGKGDYTLSAKDYHIFIETQTKVNKGSDGKNYINIKNFIVNGDLKGELVLDLKNLFNGEHEELADAALKFAHDQSKVVSKLLQGPISDLTISHACLLDLLDSSSDDDSDFEFDVHMILARSRRRSIWVENHIENRKDRGDYNILEDLSEKKFHEYFKISREVFDALHSLVQRDIEKQNTNMRQCISSKERLAVCLR